MKYAVVINVSKRALRIPELRQVVPVGSLDEKYVLPYDIAIKYKQFLRPVFYIDTELEKKKKEEEDRKKQLDRQKKLEEKKKKRSGPRPLKGVKLNPNKSVKKKKVVDQQNRKYKYKKENKG